MTETVHNVTSVPPTEPAAEQTPEVVAVAEKLVRTKKLAKTAFARIGVPVLIGSAAAFVATRNRDKSLEELDETSYNVIDHDTTTE